jgi:hypothetical protein
MERADAVADVRAEIALEIMDGEGHRIADHIEARRALAAMHHRQQGAGRSACVSSQRRLRWSARLRWSQRKGKSAEGSRWSSLERLGRSGCNTRPPRLPHGVVQRFVVFAHASWRPILQSIVRKSGNRFFATTMRQRGPEPQSVIQDHTLPLRRWPTG